MITNPRDQLFELSWRIRKYMIRHITNSKKIEERVRKIYKRILLTHEEEKTGICTGILKYILEEEKLSKDKEIMKEFGITKSDLNKYYKLYVFKYEKEFAKVE